MKSKKDRPVDGLFLPFVGGGVPDAPFDWRFAALAVQLIRIAGRPGGRPLRKVGYFRGKVWKISAVMARSSWASVVLRSRVQSFSLP